MKRTKTTVRILRLGSALVMTLSLGACVATVGAKNLTIPRDSAQICAGHCQSIGMRLGAVAIMAENVGCVCQFPQGPGPTASGAGELSTPAAGMATIAAQEAAMAAAQASQRRTHQTY